MGKVPNTSWPLPMACADAALPLSLTGGRDYIHGADVFDAVVAATGASGALRLRFVGLSARPLQLVGGMAPAGSPEVRGYVDFSRGGNGASAQGWLRETDGETPVERLSPSDDAGLQAAQFGDGQARVVRQSLFTTMKTSVLLAAALLEKSMPLDVLNLGELEAYGAAREGSLVEVMVARRMGKFIVLSVRVDDAPYGRITIAATPYQEGERHE